MLGSFPAKDASPLNQEGWGLVGEAEMSIEKDMYLGFLYSMKEKVEGKMELIGGLRTVLWS